MNHYIDFNKVHELAHGSNPTYAAVLLYIYYSLKKQTVENETYKAQKPKRKGMPYTSNFTNHSLSSLAHTVHPT